MVPSVGDFYRFGPVVERVMSQKAAPLCQWFYRSNFTIFLLTTPTRASAIIWSWANRADQGYQW